MNDLKKEISELEDSYFKWLKDETRLSWANDTTKDCLVISTPYLDRHNDFLEMVVVHQEDGYRLSDDGYILADLEASGCGINTKRRNAMLTETLNGFGIKFDAKNQTLFTETNAEDFAPKKHALLQAMMAVNDIFFTVKSATRSFFLDDVRSWMCQQEIPFIENTSFTGKSGFIHKFDFALPKTLHRPERFIKTLNNPNKAYSQNLIMAWEDTKPARRDENVEAFAMLNDKDPLAESVIAALRNYDITPIPWSQRDQALENLG